MTDSTLPCWKSSYRGLIMRRFCSVALSESTAKSTSSRVVSRPSVRRSDPWAISWGRPMAKSTWLGSSEPEVQALPEDTQMPRAASCNSMPSPSMNSKEKFTLLARRLSQLPLSLAEGISARMRRMAWSRRASWRLCSGASSSTANSAARAKPTMPGTFSVEPRRPRSCCPPSRRFSSFTPRRTYKSPTPLGP